MRIRLRRNRATKAHELVIQPRGSESMNYRKAAWLAQNQGPAILVGACKYARNPKGEAVVYDISGCTSLRGYARRRVLDEESLRGMLVCLTQALSWCAHSGFAYHALLLDARYAYVDKDACLRLALVPFDGIALRPKNSPLSFMEHVASLAYAGHAPPENVELGNRLTSFVRLQGGVFSLNGLRDFVRTETGVGVLGDGSVDARDSLPWTKASDKGGQGGYVLRHVRLGRDFALTEDAYTKVGRDTQCNVRLVGMPRISRLHAIVRVRGNSVLLRDLGSANGTFLDGERLAPLIDVQTRLGKTFFLADEPFCVEQR